MYATFCVGQPNTCTIAALYQKKGIVHGLLISVSVVCATHSSPMVVVEAHCSLDA